MTVFAITAIVVIAIIVIVVLALVGMYNGFVKLKNNVEEAFATMDVYLKKRFDLIPNLVQTVKGYAAHESETLDKVVRARSMIQNSSSQEERLDNENFLSGTLRSLFAVSEAYPDLKANENFLDLSGQLKRVEEDIANSRKYYNAVVKMYNTKREVFPSNIIAGMFHFDKKPLYEVGSQEERENVKVEF
ncbi:MAG: LemA family protein [Anaerovoracaceae bacterium]|jgi:LemA protein